MTVTAPPKRGRGRPALAAADARTSQVRVPLTADELATLQGRAERDGVPLTPAIREAALRWATRRARS